MYYRQILGQDVEEKFSQPDFTSQAVGVHQAEELLRRMKADGARPADSPDSAKFK
jgi:hypothetical protein